MTSTVIPAPGLHGVDQLRPIGGAPQPGGADGDDVDGTGSASFVGHRRDGLDGTGDRLRCEHTGVGLSLPQPCDVGAVDERVQRPVGVPLSEVELHRVGADVDDRVTPGAEPDQRLEPAGDADVAAVGETESADHGGHQGRVGRLDGELRVLAPSAVSSVGSTMQPSTR